MSADRILAIDVGTQSVRAMVFDPILVDKENIDGVLIADGFLKRDEVYGKK